MYARFSPESGVLTNISIISDGYAGSYWNNGKSYSPSIAIDSQEILHIVWTDETSGIWGGGSSDSEIMYAKFSPESGLLSNVSVVSDGYESSYWNDGVSYYPKIAVDFQNELHIVWSDDSSGKWKAGSLDDEIMYVKTTSGVFSNITIISDGYAGLYKNEGASMSPCIDIDKFGHIHVAWMDYSDNIDSWGSDTEIMFSLYTQKTGWSYPKVISDGYKGFYWNNGSSSSPDIAVDSQGNTYVVWSDDTNSSRTWGTDNEIMIAKHVSGEGWSNVTVISEFKGNYWNDDDSYGPSIAIDVYDNIHVVWWDETNNFDSWGSDTEIMYSLYTPKTDWSYPIVISDGYDGSYWNDGYSGYPAIVSDNEENLHVVWYDYSEGPWRNSALDYEIFYATIYNPIDATNMLGSFSLTTDADIPDNDGIFNLKWTESEFSEEYTIYIDKNGTMEEFAIGILDRTFTVMGLSDGNYTFQVKAINEFGNTSSNKLNVTVLISSSEKDTTDNSDDTTDDEDNSNGNNSISFGSWYLGFLTIGVISIVAIIHQKQKR